MSTSPAPQVPDLPATASAAASPPGPAGPATASAAASPPGPAGPATASAAASPPGPAGPRRQARERALSLLYEADVKETTPEEVLAGLPVEPDPFAVELVAGVGENSEEVDRWLRRYARDWAVERMPAIDRALLRIGVFELLHRPDVPTAVVLSEAVELATRYSTEDSGRFVNGLLARIADEVRPV